MAVTAGNTVGARYRLHAFICGPGCVMPGDHMGLMTYGQILAERPSKCRYAVVETTTIPEKVLVIDLWQTIVSATNIVAPPAIMETDNVDAAIMRAALLYEA